MKTKPCLTLDDCKKITAACEAEARRNKWDVVIAILDDGGHLLMLERMDGATPANAESQSRRAAAPPFRAARPKCGRTASRSGRVSMLKMPVLPVQGGIPIMYEGECVGGIGVLRGAVARGRTDCTSGRERDRFVKSIGARI